jgi:hypothetical protein
MSAGASAARSTSVRKGFVVGTPLQWEMLVSAKSVL